MKRYALSSLLCLALVACGGTAPTAQQTSNGVISTSGGSAHAQVNAIRAKAKLPAIKRSSTLDAAARAHANDMAKRNFFGHKGSNGSTVGQRTTSAGYRWCTVAENISKGFKGQAAAIESWRTSPGHYRNMTKRNAREFGLANVGDVWVMVLAAKKC